jgi:hypothetical protein
MMRDPRAYLINLPIVRACIVKWNEGRKKHGEIFIGDPLAEAFEECLDLVHYVDQIELTTDSDRQLLDEVRRDTLRSAKKLQMLYRAKKSASPTGVVS